MNCCIKKLINSLEWVEDDTLLVGKYSNMKLHVKVKDDIITDTFGYVFIEDDWNLMYELLEYKSEVESLITKKYLYGS